MMTVNLDTRDFDHWFTQYAQRTLRALPDAINKRAYFILRNVIKILRKSKASDIRRELNAPSRISPRLTVAEAIVNKERREAGQPALRGRDLKAAAKKLIGKRIASIGFLKSFFGKAAKVIGDVIGKRFNNKADWGRPNSRATVAIPGARVEAVFESMAGDAKSGPIVAKALQQAIDEEARSIAVYMGGVLDPNGGSARRLLNGYN